MVVRFLGTALVSAAVIVACGGKSVGTGAHAEDNDLDGGAIPTRARADGAAPRAPLPKDAPAPDPSVNRDPPRPPDDPAEPTRLCGNGIRELGESCDGRDLNGETCGSITMNARVMGELRCSASCTFDLSGCVAQPIPRNVGGAYGYGGTVGYGGTWGVGGQYRRPPPLRRWPPLGAGGTYGR